MASDLKTRAKDLILGTLVADAAAMGLHWIYDQNHIRKLAPAEPEFREPLADNYAGIPGYFAHAGRQAGDPSHYGEQALIMLRSLTANNGRYDVNHYSRLFRTYFGYGGAYVGYIDNSTRETLDNFRRAEDQALSRAKAIPFDGDEMVTVAMVVKALAQAVAWRRTASAL